jgi:hypothetical protein
LALQRAEYDISLTATLDFGKEFIFARQVLV